MNLFEQIFNKVLLNESANVTVSDVEQVMDNHQRVIINYRTKGEDKNNGARIIEVYAYGLTMAGNECIRAFQPYGDTTTRVPNWKFFRLDRITVWKPTEQVFNKPADFYYKNLGSFNANGDNSMSVVYKIIDFGKLTQKEPIPDIETQLKNHPINIRDIKDGNKFKVYDTNKDQTKSSENRGPVKTPQATNAKPEVYKTDTERGLDNLQRQLDNPKKIDLSKFEPKDKDKKLAQLRKLRNTLSDKPMSLKDLNKELNKSDNEDAFNEPEPYKTDTERGLDNLQRQLDNPRKIDLSKFEK